MTASQAATAPPAQASLFANRNFRWLFGGGTISMLGDQFTLIALPWLVLRLTHDSMALGLVLTLMGIPRALFILIGGVIVDRYSPRKIMLLTKLGNALLLGLLAALVWQGTLTLPLIYAFALLLGFSSAFAMPAANSILPQAVPAELLQAANGVVMGMRQLTTLAGPVAAGALIAFTGNHTDGGMADQAGLSISFAIDAASFAISFAILLKVRVEAKPQATEQETAWQSLTVALRQFWSDRPLRTLCLYFAAIACFVAGPISVAMPILVNSRLAGGAASLGLLLTGHSAGTMLGMLLASVRPHWRLGTLGATMLAADAISGLVFVPLGRIDAAWQGMVLLAPLGIMAGFIQIAVFTWMQKRMPPAMLGRFMSLFMFIFLGLTPLASAIAGMLLQVITPAALFAWSGITLVVIAALGAALTGITQIRDAAPQ